MATRSRTKTLAALFLGKASIQAFIAIALTLAIVYGFVTDKISGEALIGLYGGPIAMYFGLKNVVGARAK